MTSERRPTKNERRAAAREQARQQHLQRQRRERMTRGLTIGGIVLGAIAIVVIVGLVIVNAIRPPGPGPENMASDGIVIGEGYVAETTSAIGPDEGPTPTEERDDIVQIVIYQDYMCPFCGQFESANGATIAQLLETGGATVEYHPVSILDNASLGERFSTRAANAAGCVAEFAPDSFFDWNALMFANQPVEGTSGLSNEEIIGYAEDAGVDVEGDFTECVNSGRFDSWVERATDDAFSEDGPTEDDEVLISSTPTVYVNGELYSGAPSDATSFQAFLTSAAGGTTDPEETEDPEATEEPAESADPEATETPAPSDGE